MYTLETTLKALRKLGCNPQLYLEKEHGITDKNPSEKCVRCPKYPKMLNILARTKPLILDFKCSMCTNNRQGEKPCQDH